VADFAVRSLPSSYSVRLPVGESLYVTIDSRLAAMGVRYINQGNRALSLVTNNASLVTFIQPGLTSRNYPEGIYALKLTNDDSEAEPAMFAIEILGDEVPASADVIPFSVGIDRIGSASVGNDGTNTNLIVTVPANMRYRLLGCRAGMYFTGVGGAANGTSVVFGNITTGLVAVAPARLMLGVRHQTGGIQFTVNAETGWIVFPEPGIVLDVGQDLGLQITHQTSAGTAPSNSVSNFNAEAFGVLEPAPLT
jgi:hypothetical protein